MTGALSARLGRPPCFEKPKTQWREALTTKKKDIYASVTDKIVAELEKGVRPWIKPWNAEHAAGRITRPLRSDGATPYNGINVIALWMAATAKGYAAPIWMTYKQALELGGQVRKGEKSELVVYANSFKQTEQDDHGNEVERDIPFMKGYAVFNVEQIEGLPGPYYETAAPTLDPVERIAHADRFFEALKAEVRHGGTRAYYAVTSDTVQMPPFETFASAESYYATLAHECTHNAAFGIMRVMPISA